MHPNFTTPSSRWTALTTRDPSAASAFIYSVLTTHIYCRPSCPSRLARRSNIIFHDTPAEAEAAGFRPCLRCKPSSDAQPDPQRIAVEKACVLLKGEEEGQAGTQKWSVKGLAKEVGLTEAHFCRVFKRVSGVTVGEYRRRGYDARILHGVDDEDSERENSVAESLVRGDSAVGLDDYDKDADWMQEWLDLEATPDSDDFYVLGDMDLRAFRDSATSITGISG
ncbi:hypothetical protein B0O99DRAFT_609892 [Bisporella sp. PMI_857]|nr:hypothetical protein B0O99DRAFT_609892 [Bisporella sp. PMI_857]